MSKKLLSEEDKALFREAMKSVKPLKSSNQLPRELDKPPSFIIKTKRKEESKPKSMHFLSNYYTEEVNSESILSFHGNGFPAKRWKELKHGRIAWEARLDLHGLKTEEAQHALLYFISKSVHHQQRCVLIIHGKGGVKGEAPVLKNLVNHWLKQIPEVLAFHSALPKEGGAGAVVVFLKRDKS